MSDSNSKKILWLKKVQKVLLLLLFADMVALVYYNVLPLYGVADRDSYDTDLIVFDTAVPVQQIDNGLFGNISVSSSDGISLAKAQLLINGVVMGNFADGEVIVRVYPGDIIDIDGSAYKRQVSFMVNVISSNIDDNILPKEIKTNGDVVQVGIISFD